MQLHLMFEISHLVYIWEKGVACGWCRRQKLNISENWTLEVVQYYSFNIPNSQTGNAPKSKSFWVLAMVAQFEYLTPQNYCVHKITEDIAYISPLAKSVKCILKTNEFHVTIWECFPVSSACKFKHSRAKVKTINTSSSIPAPRNLKHFSFQMFYLRGGGISTILNHPEELIA